jgi:hypothetical protein
MNLFGKLTIAPGPQMQAWYRIERTNDPGTMFVGFAQSCAKLGKLVTPGKTGWGDDHPGHGDIVVLDEYG